MKKLFTTLLCSLAITSAFSQDCKYVKETTDPFSKKVTRTAQMAIGMGLAGREVLLQQIDGKYYFGLRITFSDVGNMPFKKGNKISFKLENDDLIEISPKEDVPASPLTMLGVSAMQWIVLQEVKIKTFQQLAASRIIAIKFTLKNEYLLPEIKERQTRKIMETAACMIGEEAKK